MEVEVKEQFRSRISRFIHRQDDYLGEMRKIANEKDFEICLFGGASRGGWKSESYRPRDYDLVVDDKGFDDLINSLKFDRLRKNRFGGVKAVLRSMTYDIWPLSQTWAFSQNLVKNEGMSSLPKTTFFNADAIGVNLKSTGEGRARDFYEEGFYECFTNRILDINLKPNPFPELCLISVIKLSLQYDLNWSQDLLEYIYEVFEKTSIRDLIELEVSHYSSRILTFNGFDSLKKSIESYLSNSNFKSYNVFQNELGFY